MHFHIEKLEARVGIEPTYKGFADLSLTTWVPRQGTHIISKIARMFQRVHRQRPRESFCEASECGVRRAREPAPAPSLRQFFATLLQSISGRWISNRSFSNRSAPIRSSLS